MTGLQCNQPVWIPSRKKFPRKNFKNKFVGLSYVNNYLFLFMCILSKHKIINLSALTLKRKEKGEIKQKTNFSFSFSIFFPLYNFTFENHFSTADFHAISNIKLHCNLSFSFCWGFIIIYYLCKFQGMPVNNTSPQKQS